MAPIVSRGRAAAAAATAVLLVALAGCSGSSSGGTKPTPSASGSGSSTSGDASAQYFTTDSGNPVATASGQVPSGIDGPAIPATLHVYGVTVRGGSTVLRAGLTSTSTQTVSPDAFATAKFGKTMDGVTLTSQATDQVFRPSYYLERPDPATGFTVQVCACPQAPGRIDGAGVAFSILYAPLPDSITSVALNVPGFPATTVPVTRS